MKAILVITLVAVGLTVQARPNMPAPAESGVQIVGELGVCEYQLIRELEAKAAGTNSEFTSLRFIGRNGNKETYQYTDTLKGYAPGAGEGSVTVDIHTCR